MFKRALIALTTLLLSTSALFAQGGGAISDRRLVYNSTDYRFERFNGDPVHICGIGDPEGFLYLGAKQGDGTRTGGGQDAMIQRLIAEGGNSIYLQIIRDWGGDGGQGENPFVDEDDPASALDQDILNQWHGWFAQLDAADIILHIQIFDDSTCPSESGTIYNCNQEGPGDNRSDAVSAVEQTFVEGIVNEFEGYDNLMWITAEEYIEVWTSGHMVNLADIIAAADDNNHPIGVHQTPADRLDAGLRNQTNVNFLDMQFCGTLDGPCFSTPLHGYAVDAVAQADADGNGIHYGEMRQIGNDPVLEFDDEGRRQLWAIAMANLTAAPGVRWDLSDLSSPPNARLNECRAQVALFEDLDNLNDLRNNDAVAAGSTEWVIKNPANDTFIAYTRSYSSNMGVDGMAAGDYTLTWLDTINLNTVTQNVSVGAGTNTWSKPGSITSNEVALSIQGEVSAPTATINIPLTVVEPGDATRLDTPVTSGVPLPVGTQLTNWSLWEGAVEIPVQITNLNQRTPWLLLDFQANLPSGSTATYTLKDIPSTVSLADTLVTQDGATEVTVATGPIKVAISKTSYDGIETVWYDSDGDDVYEAGEVIVNSPTNGITVVDATTGSTFQGADANATFTWEYRDDIRSVLLVEGEYASFANGLNYQTRYTFYAGRPDVKIEHVVVNSLEPNERNIKLESATFKIGNGTATGRRGEEDYQVWASVDTTGYELQILPPTFRNGVVNTDSNGGLPIPDWSHYGAELVADFEPQAGQSAILWAQRNARLEDSHSNPLFAAASPDWYSLYGQLGIDKFSTLQDEIDSYTDWGWEYSGLEPSQSHDSGYYVGARDLDIHDETESDDLWQNSIMYLRMQPASGARGFLDFARGWNRYYRQEFTFRTNGFNFDWDGSGESPKVTRSEISIPETGSDNTYLGEFSSGRVDTRSAATHVWGWGLGVAYRLWGDVDSKTALIDIAEISESTHLWETPGDPNRYPGNPGNQQRGYARHWLLTTMAWEVTGDTRWQTLMDHQWDLWDQCVCWDQIAPNIGNYWTPDQSGHAKGVRINHWNWVAQAHGRYWDVTGDTDARDRVIALGNFAATYALDPHDHSNGLSGCSDSCAPNCDYEYTGSYYALDVPNEGDVWHANPDSPTCSFDKLTSAESMDAIVRAYRITGDMALIKRAKKHWDRVQANTGFPITRPTFPAMTQFVNGDGRANDHLFKRNGEMSFSSLLFYETATLNSEIIDIGDNEWVEITPNASTRRILDTVSDNCPGTITSSTQPMGRAFTGLVAGGGKLYFFGGGHGSYPGNDVEVYDIDSNTWTQSYTPECCDDQISCGQNCCTSIHGGSPCRCQSVSNRPLVEHTYNYADYDTLRGKYISDLCSGTWNFDATTMEWTLLNSSGVGCPNAANGLGIYDKGEDKYIFFAGQGAGVELESFDPTTNLWTTKQALPSAGTFGFEAEGTYDELHDNHWIISKNHPGQKRFWRYDLVANTLTEVTSGLNSAFTNGIDSGKTSIDWDERNERIVVLNGKDSGALEIWVGDEDGTTFLKQPTVSPTPTDHDSAPRPGWGLFKYDDKYDVFFYVYGLNGSNEMGGSVTATELWAYRYNASNFGAGAPPIIIPPDPTPLPTVFDGGEARGVTIR